MRLCRSGSVAHLFCFAGLPGGPAKARGGADAMGIGAAIVLAAELAERDFSAEIDRSPRQLVAAPAI
jgi:hypothetical protein